MQTNKIKPEQIRPREKMVKIEVIPPREIKTKTGIIIPAFKRKEVFEKIEYYEAVVLELGAKVKELTKNQLTVNDVVIVNKFAGFGIPTIGDKYIKVVDHTMVIGKKLNGKNELNMKELKPRFERILVKIDNETEEKTEAGIIIPHKEKSIFDSDLVKGTVVAVSDDVNDVQKGEKIIFENSVGTPLNSEFLPLTEGEYRMILKYDVLATINN